MRPGQDRHDVAETITELLFPEDAGHIRGIRVGDPVAEIVGREGTPRTEGNGAIFDFEVDDPFEHGRRVELRVNQQLGRASIVTAFFYSANRLDVDSAYRIIRKRLKAHHGKPDKELTGVLKFIYELVDVPHPSTTSVCRYKDNDSGENVLEVATRAAEGVTFSNQAPLANAKRAKNLKGPPPGSGTPPSGSSGGA